MPERPEDPVVERSTRRWMIAGIALTVLFLLAFPIYRISEPANRAEARATLTESLTEQGQELFAANCAPCHGATGDGVDAPALNSQQFLSAATDEQIASLIAHGVPGTAMSAYSLDFGGYLTLEQIEAVATFIRSWEPNAPDRPDWRSPEGGAGLDEEEPAPEADAAELFAVTCAVCHNTDLSGGVGLPLDATSLSATEPDEHLIETITFGRDGMPSFADELTEGQILALVAYIREVQAEG